MAQTSEGKNLLNQQGTSFHRISNFEFRSRQFGKSWKSQNIVYIFDIWTYLPLIFQVSKPRWNFWYIQSVFWRCSLLRLAKKTIQPVSSRCLIWFFFKEQVKKYPIPSRPTSMDIRKRFRHCSTCHQTNFVCFSIVDLSFDCICHHLFIYRLVYWTAMFGFNRKFDVQK